VDEILAAVHRLHSAHRRLPPCALHHCPDLEPHWLWTGFSRRRAAACLCAVSCIASSGLPLWSSPSDSIPGRGGAPPLGGRGEAARHHWSRLL
jgi:hypothetical protein